MTIVAMGSDARQMSDTIPPQKPASWGQFLLPLCFAAMETCWVDAIFIGLADTGVLGSTRLLFPLWLPFVLTASFYIFSSYQRWYKGGDGQALPHKRAYLSAHLLVTTVLTAIATLFTLWISYATPQTALTDAGWLLNMPAIILQFNQDSFRLIGIIILAIAFCRQGSLLARGRIDYGIIAKLIQSGIFTFVLLLVIQKFLEVTGHAFDDGVTILFLIVLYLCLSLATHALARVGVVRRQHSVGKKNDLLRQERVTLQSVVLASSVLLVIALGIGAILNATIIGDTGVLYFKANSFIVPPLGHATKPVLCGTSCTVPATTGKDTVHHMSQQPTNTVFAIILSVLFILLLLTVVVCACVFIIRLVRWWRKRERPRRRMELRESVWSWHLFWEQCTSVLHAILKRVMAFTLRSPGMIETSFAQDRQNASSYTIYEIYRCLLHDASKQGYPRANYETANEFGMRLAHKYPLLEAHLATITLAYVTTRYADAILKPEDVSATHYAWMKVQQNWQAQEKL